MKKRDKHIDRSTAKSLLKPRATTAEPSEELWPKGHRLEGFRKPSNRNAVSIISNAPIFAQAATAAESLMDGVVQPDRSALEKFAARSPEEKEKFFLIFSKLLKEEINLLRRKPN